MGILDRYQSACYDLPAGRYQATLDRLEIKPSKSGNKTLVITATLLENQSPQLLHFPLHLPFKLRDARQAFEVLLSKEDPEDDSELYRLAYKATGKQFTLVVEKHTDKAGRVHVNKRVETAEEMVRLAGQPSVIC